MSSRVEPTLPTTFYKYIDTIHPEQWLKFVRLLGLVESELQSVASRHNLGLTEKKYQMLTRWKMFLGSLPDQNIENLLKLARYEIDIGRFDENASDYEFCPTSMKSSAQFARNIYIFIETYEWEEWLRLARNMLEDKEVRRLKESYQDNLSETKYQMVLRWQRVQQIRDNRVMEGLRLIEQQRTANSGNNPIS